MKALFLTIAVTTAALAAIAAPRRSAAGPDGTAALCGVPRASAFAREECAAGETPVRLVICRKEATGKVAARSERCRRGEAALSLAEVAEASGALVPDGVLTTPGDDGAVAGINKCGQAACLCSGSFCADLIDAGYCEDFHCAPGQCICIF
ncbi:MAG: hypothetical protein AB1689_09950 [Thermodesulfobacteriota bacterium]